MEHKHLLECLRSPDTGKALTLVTTSPPEESDTGWARAIRTGKVREPLPFGSTWLRTTDGSESYPVVGGFPVLLAPEKRVRVNSDARPPSYDLNDLKYAEAYEEMSVYNAMCEDLITQARQGDESALMDCMGNLVDTTPDDDSTFPRPPGLWVDARHDSVSQYEAYDYLAPIEQTNFMQMGGQGSHAVKALLAGASEAFLLTPMLGEASVATYLAERFGVADRLHCVIGIGEELPFNDEVFDRIYSGGCFHHMRLEFAARELKRVLKPSGRFSGVDPWKTPLHTIGTKLIGKREKSVFCKPITSTRLSSMEDHFEGLTIGKHGPLLRYLFLAFEKLGVRLPVAAMLRITQLDDSIARLLRLQNYGGSLVIAGTKPSSAT